MPLRLAVDAMGTRFEAVLAGGPEPLLLAAGEAALHEIVQWDRRLSLFRPDSTLAHVNRSAADGPVAVDAEMFELLCACRDLHAATGGAFDPTVAPLMRALGLHARHAHADDAIAPIEARQRVGFDLVNLDADRRTVRFARPGVSLDLGSIAKGHALDAAAELLRQAGVPCALVHGGTSGVVAIGAPPGQIAWRVRIPLPPPTVPSGAGAATHGSAGADVPTLVAHLCDRALSVSAPAGRTAPGPGGIVTHVLDPRTGQPARGAAVVGVTAPRARDADAWSTALLVDFVLTARAPATLGWGVGDGRGWRIGGVRDLVIDSPECVAEGA